MNRTSQGDFEQRVRVNQQKLSSEFTTRLELHMCGAGTSGCKVPLVLRPVRGKCSITGYNSAGVHS